MVALSGMTPEEGTYDENGVDLTLIEELASWTPYERALHNDAIVADVLAIEAALATVGSDRDPR
jgi:hypothetical protein